VFLSVSSHCLFSVPSSVNGVGPRCVSMVRRLFVMSGLVVFRPRCGGGQRESCEKFVGISYHRPIKPALRRSHAAVRDAFGPKTVWSAKSLLADGSRAAVPLLRGLRLSRNRQLGIILQESRDS